MANSSMISRLRGIVRSDETIKEDQPERHNHLYGLRGLLAVSSIFWIFFHTFNPALVDNETKGPSYQKAIRIIFSPLLWNETLISSFFFALSARSIAVRFLRDPKATNFAGSVIRRVVRMSLAVGLASGIASAIFKGLGIGYIDTFKNALPNQSITSLETANNGLTALNSIFDLFWVVRSYYYQAANHFWPSQTIWAVSLIYQQSWTIYFLMVILPFTRVTWHFEGLVIFGIGSFWMNSWGWFDAAALILADYSVNPKLQPRLEEGLKINEDWKIPFAAPAFVMIMVGAVMKYAWTALPQYVNEELVLHPFVDLSENVSRSAFAAADPYPRLDNFLVIFGVLLMVETTPQIKSLLSRNGIVWLGKRSLSLFVAQSIVFWSAGIKLYLHLHVTQGTSSALAKFAVFVICTMATFFFSEVYYRALDLPSQWFAKTVYSWLLV